MFVLATTLAPATTQAAALVVAWCGGGVGNWSDLTWGINTFGCGNIHTEFPNNGGGDTYTVGIDSYDDPLTGPGLDRNGLPLNTAQPSTVNLDVSVTISDLVIGNNDVLSINDARSLTIDNVGGGINIFGQLNLDSSGSNTSLAFSGGDLSFTGGGNFNLSNHTTNRIFSTINTDRLTLEATMTLTGAGQIGLGQTKLTNRGTMNANQSNTLTIDPTDGAGGVINSGVMKATVGGTLVLQGGSFENSEGMTNGEIQADNATVNVSSSSVTGGVVTIVGTGEIKLNTGTISGGTVTNSATGIIRSDSGSSTLGGIVNNVGGGQIIIDDATTLTLVNTGTYTNNGDLLVNSAGNNTTLTVGGGEVTVGGTGTITLSNFTTNRILGAVNTDRLVLGVDQTLAGAGQIGVGTMKLTNHGTINANQSNLLTIDPTNGAQGVINSGTLKATGGRTLVLQGGTFENFDGGTLGQILADNATVNVSASTVSGGMVATLGTGELKLNSSAVTGGTVNNSATGIIRSDTSTNTLGGIVTNVGGGQIIIDDATTLTLVNTGTYTNDGDLALNSAGNNTTLTVSGGEVTVGGTGTMTLSNFTTNRILGAVNTDRLVLGVDQTLAGAGQIGVGTMKLTNHGTINANQSNLLTIDPTNGAQGVINSGTLKATGGRTLVLQGGTFENFDGGTLGQILADNATVNVSASTVSGGMVATLGTGELKLNSSAVTGGTVNNSATGIIRSDTSTNTLGGIVTNVGGGQIIVDDATTLTLVNTGTYTNEGDLALNSAGSNTTLTVSGGEVTVGGTGTITLSNFTTNRILGAVNTDRLVLGVDQTLAGAGQIGVGTMKLTNHGTINANQSNLLTIDPTNGAQGVINSGTLKATGGRTLVLQGGTFENFDGGTLGQILADNATVNVSASTVSGGMVATLGTGELKLNSSAVTGGTVNNSATGIIRSDTSTNTLGGIVTNVGGGQIIVGCHDADARQYRHLYQRRRPRAELGGQQYHPDGERRRFGDDRRYGHHHAVELHDQPYFGRNQYRPADTGCRSDARGRWPDRCGYDETHQPRHHQRQPIQPPHHRPDQWRPGRHQQRDAEGDGRAHLAVARRRLRELRRRDLRSDPRG